MSPLKSLRLKPRSAVTAALISVTLAVGLAGVLVVLAVADAVFERPLPYPQDEDLLFAFSSLPEERKSYLSTSRPNYLDWRSSARTVELEAVSTSRSFSLTGVENPRPLSGEYVSAGYFDLLGVGVVAGRGFDADDDRTGAGLVAVVSQALARELFGSESAALGKAVRLADRTFEIVGVLHGDYRGILWDPVDLWVPMAAAGEILGERFRTDRDMDWHLVVGRLRPGFTVDQTREDLDGIATALERLHPRANHGKRIHVESLRSFYFGGELRRGLTYLLLAALLVLLLVIVNLVILALGQSTDVAREVAVRRAMGAPVSHLFATLAGPLVLPLSLGLVLAFALAWWLTPRLISLSDIPPATLDVHWVDARVAAAAFVLAGFVGLAVTGISFLVHARSSVSGTLRASDGTGGRQLRFLERLVVAETTIAVVLLMSSGLLLSTLAGLRSGDLGFRIDRVGALRIDLQPSRYDDPATRARFVESLVRDPPSGFEAVAVSGPRIPPRVNLSASLVPEGAASELDRLDVYRQSISPSLLGTLEMTLVEGRDFSAADHAEARKVALISATTAAKLGGDEVLGRRFRLLPELPGDPLWTVVGVVGDVASRDLSAASEGEPDVYLPYAQAPERSFYLLGRVVGGTAPSRRQLGLLEESVRALDHDLPLAPPETLAQRFSSLTADERFRAAVSASFSAVAWTLTLLGLFGVIDLSVRARRRELAVRVAVGASRPRLAREVMTDALRLAGGGLLAGIVLALLARRAFEGLVGAVEPHGPLLVVSVCSLVLLTVVAAVALPALRAQRVDAPAELVRGT